jgi:uncharacterized protein YraI
MLIALSMATVSVMDSRAQADEFAHEATARHEESEVSFERNQFTVTRQKGEILIDGIIAPPHVLEKKGKEIRLIETFDGLKFSTDRQFFQWARKLQGTRTYTYDEVIRSTGDGAAVSQPLVFFDADERSKLDPKWHAWLAERESKIEAANRARLAQEQETMRYQQILQIQQLQTNALIAQATAAEKSSENLAVISGATSLWEVELVPAGNSSTCYGCSQGFNGMWYGIQSSGLGFLASGANLNATFGGSFNNGTVSKSMFIRAYGRTSQAASDYAVYTHPGYRAGSIRRLGGY